MRAEGIYHVSKTRARPRDACGIEQAARAALAAHSHFRGRADHFVLVASEEAIVVSGAVPSFYLKQLLQSILQAVDGVQRVHNQVAVISPHGVSSVSRDAVRVDGGHGRSDEPCASKQT